MTQIRLHVGKLLLIALGLLFLGLVAGISWVGYKAHRPEELSFAQVHQALIGNTPTVVHRVVGWGSKRYGIDDGIDWIEFATDASGLKALLDSRPFVQIPADRPVGLRDWALNPDEWRGLHATYEDDSDFDKHGTIYYLMTQNHEDGVLAVIARSQQ